jgi:hypothetical protein
MVKWGLLICLFVLLNNCKANDTIVSLQLLTRIANLQNKESAVFPRGIFPSYRLYALNKNRSKADINIFFTGLISFTLQKMRTYLTPYQQSIAEQIIASGNEPAIKFKNQKGRNTYNFWPTDTPRIFPNSGWLNLFNKKQALPDDLDDTVIILLAMHAQDSIAKQVHELMQQYTNSGKKKVKNTFKAYRNIPAYSTWFGKKMPVDFDVSVLTNILYFVQHYNLPWSKADSASLVFIQKVIEEKKYINDADYVSPHYSSSTIILYHISRLMSLKPIPELDMYKDSLISFTKGKLLKTNNFLEQILLQTSLMRWGVQPSEVITVKNNSELINRIEDEDFSFFIANMASMLPNELKKTAGAIGLGKFYYFCPAYNYVLILENLLEQKKHELTF